MGIFLIFN